MTMDIILRAIEAKLQSAGMGWIKLQSLQLRPKDKTLTVEVLLEGEPSAVTVQAGYEVAEDHLKIVSLTTSKVWMTEAANLALLKTWGQILLPGGFKGKAIKFFL